MVLICVRYREGDESLQELKYFFELLSGGSLGNILYEECEFVWVKSEVRCLGDIEWVFEKLVKLVGGGLFEVERLLDLPLIGYST